MDNNITIGVSKEMVGLLKSFGNFGIEKVQQLYPLMVQRIIINNVAGLLFAFLLVYVVIGWIKHINKHKEQDEEIWGMGVFICGLISLVAVIIIVCNVTILLTCKLEAVQQLVKMFTGK